MTVPGAVLTATFRPRRNWVGIAFDVPYLLLWTIGELTAPLVLLYGLFHPPEGLLIAGPILVWLAGWTSAGRQLFRDFAIAAWGRHEVMLGEEALIVRTAIGLRAKARSYPFDEIRDFRTNELGKGGRRLVFAHLGDTVSVEGLVEDGAFAALVRTLEARLPPASTPLPERALRRIRITGAHLEVRHGVGRLAWTRRYDRARIRDVRAVPVEYEDGPSLSQHEVAFKHGGKTIRIGGPVGYGEALVLADHLRERLLVHMLGTPN